MTAALDVEPRWLALVRSLLAEHAPRPCRVVGFGSRVQGRARRFSDLDLAFDAGRPLTLRDEARLADAFDESDLPWRVDVVDLATCSPRFKGRDRSAGPPGAGLARRGDRRRRRCGPRRPTTLRGRASPFSQKQRVLA